MTLTTPVDYTRMYVDAGLSSMDDIAYVMGLIRQSFERQMGNGTNKLG